MNFFGNKYNQIKNFFGQLSGENLEHLSLTKYKPYSYIDLELPLEKKILQEKRRRYQAYMAIDYAFSGISYFDFFSVDAFLITKKAKEITQFFKKQIVTSDVLLLPFFGSESNKEIINLLEDYGINEKELMETICNSQGLNTSLSLKENMLGIVKKILFRIDIPAISESFINPLKTKFSYEINEIFEKASINSKTRFKTPVISSEILLITMLEAKKSKVGKILKKALKNDLNWYMLRYGLIKRLHQQELNIRTEVPKNYQYFAYLLKLNLPEVQFDTLLDKECLLPGVMLYRNTLVQDTLKQDLLAQIRNDTFASIKMNRGVRKYSDTP
jgi:hypothetical protein